jgi:hypothetical protein
MLDKEKDTTKSRRRTRVPNCTRNIVFFIVEMTTEMGDALHNPN